MGQRARGTRGLKSWAIGTVTLLFAAGAWAQIPPINPGMNQVPSFQQSQPKPYTVPNGMFTVQVPAGWVVAYDPERPNQVEFRAVHYIGEGRLFVRKLDVPASAHPRQIITRAIDERIGKLPMVRIVQRRDVTVAGHPAASVVATYKYQGNMQFPRAIEEVAVVFDQEAFVFHFECFDGVAAKLAPQVEQFYRTFSPGSAPPEPEQPQLSPEQEWLRGFNRNKPVPFSF